MLDFLYPSTCFGCSELLYAEERSDGVCEPCGHILFRVTSPRCPRCATPREVAVGVDDLCLRCIMRPPAFDSAFACWLYDGPVRAAIRRAKADDDEASLLQLAAPMSDWFADVAQKMAPAAWTAVPAHAADLRRRGWNPPSRLLGRLERLSRVDLPRSRGLVKRIATTKQASLDRLARWENMEHVFSWEGPPVQRLVIFDDVLTTGATLHHAARAARAGGVENVVVVVAARATAFD